MKKRKKVIYWIIIVSLILSIIGLLTYNKSFDNLNQFDPNIIAAIIAGSVTIIGYYVSRYYENKKIIEQQIRAQKLPTYEEFINFLFEMFKQSKKNKNNELNKIEDFIWSMNKKSILWLSDRTLKSYINWRRDNAEFALKENKTHVDNLEVINSLGKLLLDFRSDIGHKNTDISSKDILSLFINDINKS